MEMIPKPTRSIVRAKKEWKFVKQECYGGCGESAISQKRAQRDDLTDAFI